MEILVGAVAWVFTFGWDAEPGRSQAAGGRLSSNVGLNLPPRYTIEESLRRLEYVLGENLRRGRHAVVVVGLTPKDEGEALIALGPDTMQLFGGIMRRPQLEDHLMIRAEVDRLQVASRARTRV